MEISSDSHALKMKWKQGFNLQVKVLAFFFWLADVFDGIYGIISYLTKHFNEIETRVRVYARKLRVVVIVVIWTTSMSTLLDFVELKCIHMGTWFWMYVKIKRFFILSLFFLVPFDTLLYTYTMIIKVVTNWVMG